MRKRKPDRNDHVPVRDIENDTVLNVSQLLQETTGASRSYRLSLDWFALDTDLMARDVTGELKLMRVGNGLMLSGKIRGTALIECVGCLEIYEQPFETEVEQEYRPIYDVAMGSVDDDEETDFESEVDEIDDANELDLAEPIRQYAILALPMRPNCGPDCPGLGVEEEAGPEYDHRMAALAALLEESAETDDA
ncbi:MAG TPA: DUF177 domain-containing protein [Thermomicrobiales bacterium]|nr:DUF177 domain-containing protein [Thermomicrobiales bacterium]